MAEYYQIACDDGHRHLRSEPTLRAAKVAAAKLSAAKPTLRVTVWRLGRLYASYRAGAAEQITIGEQLGRD